MTFATQLDLYQLTSLVPHWDAQRADVPVWMSFFSRRLPKSNQGETVREFIVSCGLHRCLQILSTLQFDQERMNTLCAHPILGPALKSRPKLIERLLTWRFKGEVWAVEEGTLLWANPAMDEAGQKINLAGVSPSAMPPYLQVYTDLLTAKLIETPLLSILNHMSMVASKAAHLTKTAENIPILELGSRRTHIEAAIDAAVASFIGGVTGTSNVEAHHRFGVPVVGTMDHFAIQSWEQEGVSIGETERAFFKAFAQTYPESASLLVDTYDMFGETTGIKNAVLAAKEAGVTLNGIRIDSQLSVETVLKARRYLDALGADQAKIIVSGGIDTDMINELKEAPVDVYGVGERLVTSADAPVGVGAVGKLSWIGGTTSMKRAKGSGKATLPGPIQAFRGLEHDRLCLVPYQESEGQQTTEISGGFAWDQIDARQGEYPLIKQVWQGDSPLVSLDPTEWLHCTRLKCQQELKQLSDIDKQANQSEMTTTQDRKVLLDSSLVAELYRKCT